MITHLDKKLYKAQNNLAILQTETTRMLHRAQIRPPTQKNHHPTVPNKHVHKSFQTLASAKSEIQRSRWTHNASFMHTKSMMSRPNLVLLAPQDGKADFAEMYLNTGLEEASIPDFIVCH
jgi:hypothetical protein